MNTNIFYAFRAVIVLGIALFAFIGDVFAAPVLTPASVSRITETSATLTGHVSNSYKNTAVWFEVANASGTMTAVGVQPPLYDGGSGVTFEYTLDNLNQGQTYSYRSAAMEGGITVYSPTATFVTASPKVVVATPSITLPVATTEPSPKAIVEKPAATTTPAITSEGFTNNNSAAIIGAGGGMFPATLIGWIILFIAMLVVVLLGHMVFESVEKRKEAREKKKLEDENEKETE